MADTRYSAMLEPTNHLERSPVECVVRFKNPQCTSQTAFLGLSSQTTRLISNANEVTNYTTVNIKLARGCFWWNIAVIALHLPWIRQLIHSVQLQENRIQTKRIISEPLLIFKSAKAIALK
jgi:hypothetical protein